MRDLRCGLPESDPAGALFADAGLDDFGLDDAGRDEAAGTDPRVDEPGVTEPRRLSSRVKLSITGRDSWRSRHAAAEKERDEWKSRAAGLESEVAASAARGAAPQPTAAEAATSDARPEEETVLEGARWTSPDGLASFTLVRTAAGRATLGLGPEAGSIRVEAGSNVRIGDPARGSYRVTVMEIDPGRAIRISAVPETSDLLLAPSGGVASPAP